MAFNQPKKKSGLKYEKLIIKSGVQGSDTTMLKKVIRLVKLTRTKM
ncbi:MAG: hypothetical protein JWR87_3347 [Segetibacter sp.]|jgi:hypothetical protein|nr:hypothetical protein [Segetibacter sp.]